MNTGVSGNLSCTVFGLKYMKNDNPGFGRRVLVVQYNKGNSFKSH